MEDYPGQSYFHQHHPGIKRSEKRFKFVISDEEIFRNLLLKLGVPLTGTTLIVVSSVYKYIWKELTHGHININLVTLPEGAWPRHKIYMENVMRRIFMEDFRNASQKD